MLTGIFPVLPTPYRDDGSLDFDALGRVTRFAVDCGVQGVVYPGAASEVEELTPAERREAIGVVVETLKGAVPVIAGGSAPSAKESIERAGEATELGITAAMIQAPAAAGTTAEEMIAFYSEISAALPQLEIVLQNAPPPRGSNLSPKTILEVVRAVPGIRYVKEETLPSGGPISAILADKPDSLYGVMGGGGARYLVDELQRGACGAMPAVEIADVHVALDRAFRSGDVATARQLYMRTLPLLLTQAIFRMRLTKTVLMRRGVLTNAVSRSKLPEFDAVDLGEIDAWLADLGDLFKIMPVVKERALA